MNDFHLDRTTMNFGEALGIYLFEKQVIDDSRDVGQAEITRTTRSYDHNGYALPATGHIRYITRSGEPVWSQYEITPSVDEFAFELNQTLDRFFANRSTLRAVGK